MVGDCCTGEAKVPWTPGMPGKGVYCIKAIIKEHEKGI